MLVRPDNNRRLATTAVETGVVLTVCLLIMFAIFEYGRFFFMKHTLENSGREGARFAVAHTNNKTEAEIRAEVMRFLAGQDLHLDNFNADTDIEIYAIVLRDDGSGVAVGTRLASWDKAKTTDGIVVKITAKYKPTFVAQLLLPETIEMTAQSMMYSEGN